MKPLRIAVYHNVTLGGVKRALYNFVHLLSQKHQVDVYQIDIDDNRYDIYNYRKVQEDIFNLADYTEKIFEYPDPRHIIRPSLQRFFWRNSLRTLTKLMDLRSYEITSQKIAADINKGNYDLVFVHTCGFTQAPPLLKYLQIPSVFYVHELIRKFHEGGQVTKNNFLEQIIENLYRKKILENELKCAKKANLLLCNSYFTREYIYKSIGLFAKVNYLGINTKLFEPKGIKRENFVFALGTLIGNKGYNFMIESLAYLPPKIRPKLVIAYARGSDILKKQLQKQAEENQVSIDFVVRPDDSILVELYNKALLTLYPPIMEPFGLVPLESMACGTPVVGVKEGGVRETIVDGVTGVLTDRDPKLYSAAIERLLTDEAYRKKLGKTGITYIRENWTWEKSVEKFEEYLYALLESEKTKKDS